MKKYKFYFLFIILLLNCKLLFAQQDNKNVVIFKLAEIPIQIENTTEYLAAESNRILSSSIVSSSKKTFQSVNRRYSKLVEISDSASYSNSNLVQLQNLHRRWYSLKEKVEETLASISTSTNELEKDNSSQQEMLFNWEQTYQQYKDTDFPEDLFYSIKSLNEKINALIGIIEKESNELITIQIDFSNKYIAIKSKINVLDALISSRQKAVFDKNSDVIWEQISDTTRSNSLLEQAKQLASSYSDYTTSFYNFYKRKFSFGIIVFILFLVFTFGLKYYGSQIEDDNPIVHKAILLFNMPFSISFLLFLLLLSFTSENSSAFQGIRRVLMLIPLLFILLKIIDPKLRQPLFIFMFMFFINELRVSSGNDNLLGNLILLCMTFLTLIAIYWIKKDNLLSSFLHSERIVKLVEKSFNIGLALISFVILLNIFGYIALSNLLFNGFYDSVYATILFLTANLVFNAILLIILKTKLMQSFQIVIFHSEKIISTASKLIRIFLAIAWLGIILNSFNIYNFVFNALKNILSTNVGYGSFSFLLSDIILFSVTIWVSFQLSKFIQFVLEIDILPQMQLPRGVPGTITSITKYLIISLGLLIALVSIGIDFNKFALLFGALGVGIGFGLQNLVNNFISGIILIFERPVQIGDIIKVNELVGTVKKIGIRTSIIRSFEGAEIIVPNGHLISNELTNLTLSDEQRRMDILVGVEYGSDVNKVAELLVKCAIDNEKVLKEPEPVALFRNFGNSSLDFSLRCWTGSTDNWISAESELRFAINKIFEQNNITIPFPQTDINFKNGLFVNNTNENAKE